MRTKLHLYYQVSIVENPSLERGGRRPEDCAGAAIPTYPLKKLSKNIFHYANTLRSESFILPLYSAPHWQDELQRILAKIFFTNYFSIQREVLFLHL
ncbi:MAG: hypothetical protein JSS76_06740 [Bacteroidetes bacterium]|nr:hypothetical protein [Bacteroidota bacterium]